MRLGRPWQQRLAVAAALLLAIGGTVWVSQGDGFFGSNPNADREGAWARGRAVLVEDASLSLYHGMETFDRVGIEPGDLIADWSR